MSNHNTVENWNKKWVTMKEPMEKDCWVKIRMKTVASLIPKMTTVLDVACGTGYIEEFLHSQIDYTGMDFSEEGIRHVKGRKIFGDIRIIKMPERSYDTVLAMEIVEHVDDPGELIKRIAVWARNQVIITVPNDRMGPDKNVFHVAQYSKESIVKLIESSYTFKKINVLAPGGNIICQCLK